MGEITFSKYADYKAVMDAEIKGAVQGFVNIGYLLKVARDTNILQESGYKTVAEFAKVEYGLTKDVVSRYIRINDRFSKNGYSMELKVEYENYGIGKLQEMLALPDEINDVLTPELSKEQIAETRREYQEEQQITDIEVMMEEKTEVQQSFNSTLEKAMFECLRAETEVFKLVDMALNTAESIEERFELLFKALAPKGFENLFGRIPGEGKIMIVIAGRDKEITTVNMRSGDRKTYSWSEMLNALRKIWSKGEGWGDVAGRYESIYGETFKIAKVVSEPMEKTEVAPVQQKVEMPKPEPKKSIQKIESIVQQEEEDGKENEVESEVIPVEPEGECTEFSEAQRDTADIEADEQHSTMSVQRQNRKEQLEDNIAELTEEIHNNISRLTEAVRDKHWATAKLRLRDVESDIEQIEELEDEIDDLNDTSQMRLEDYEQKEE